MTRLATIGKTGSVRMPAHAGAEHGIVAAVPFDEPDPDRDLALRAAEGGRAAFEILIRRHYDRMHRIAWRMHLRCLREADRNMPS